MEIQHIITHPGRAHFDEVTAIGLIMAVNEEEQFSIERREPKAADLDNPSVWVVDTGNQHDPGKRNFDHHQSLETPASFVLVAEYLGLVPLLSIMPWWHFKDEEDRFGPEKSSAKYSGGDYLVNRSPLETWLTDRFAANPEGFKPLLKDFGIHIIEEVRTLEKQINFWKSCKRLEIDGVPAIIGENTESAGLEEFRRLVENPPDIVISLDRRSDGWRLFRFEGAPVDFSLLSGQSQIEFAHKSGFLAKTRDRLEIADLISLVSKAVKKR